MDVLPLSRKELQALCKSNGIPANKTNAFMMEALMKKRVPLLQVDANTDQRLDTKLLKSPTQAVKREVELPPPVFTNNFLRRGKRKDPPTSIEQSQRPVPGALQVKTSKAEAIAPQTLRPDQIGLAKAKVDSGVKSATLPGIAAKEAKVERRGRPETYSGIPVKREVKVQSSSKSETHSSITSREAKVGQSSESENRSRITSKEATVEKSLEPESISGIAAMEAKVIIAAVPSTSDTSTCSAKGQIEDQMRSQINTSLCTKVTKAAETQPSPPTPVESSSERADESEHVEPLSFPEAPAYQMRGEKNFSPSLDLTLPSPPISFSFLERKVGTIIDRIQNRLKRGGFALVNSFGSPVQ